MRKIYGKRDRSVRDKLYNYSDIITVLVIILIAGLFITWRINVLMSYEPAAVAPDSISSEETAGLESQKKAVPGSESPEVSENDAAAEDDQDADTDSEETEDSDQIDNSNAEFRISSGAGLSSIATDLFKLGLISDPDEFREAVTQAGLENNINTGTFSIPYGSTYDEIINIITS